VIVFVHGVGGDARSTWVASNKAFWPDLIKNDPDFSNFDIYSIGYYSPLLGKASDINELANMVYQVELKDALLKRYSEVYFITHSMGGLVTKAAVTKLRLAASDNDRDLDKVAAVIFISTPAYGADVADYASWLSKNPQFENMSSNEFNTYLKSSEDNWKQVIEGRTESHKFPKTFCAYETQNIGPISVVKRIYSEPACDGLPLAIDLDHEHIVKPTDREQDIYRWTKARILETTSIFANGQDRVALETAISQHMRPGFYETALREVDVLIARTPQYKVAYKFKGNILYKLGDYDSALSAYNEALRLDPSYSDAKFNKAAVLMQKRQYAEARDLILDLPHDQKEDVAIKLNLAECYLGLAMYENAAALYNDILQRNNENEIKLTAHLGLALTSLLQKYVQPGQVTFAIRQLHSAYCINSRVSSILGGDREVKIGDQDFPLYARLFSPLANSGPVPYKNFLHRLKTAHESCVGG